MKKDEGIIRAKQSRSRETQRKIISAVLRLLDHSNFEKVSVAQVAEEAGVAVGSFYRRFSSKDAMLPCLRDVYDERYGQWAAGIAEDKRFESEDLKTRMTALIEASIDLYRSNRGLIRALHLHSRLDSALISETSYGTRALQYEKIALLIDPTGTSVEASNLQARQIALIMVSSLNEHFLFREYTPAVVAALSCEELRQALVDAAMGIIRGSPKRP